MYVDGELVPGGVILFSNRLATPALAVGMTCRLVGGVDLEKRKIMKLPYLTGDQNLRPRSHDAGTF